MSILILCCLVINELGFAPPEAAAEFVEILNHGPVAADISRFSIYDARRSPSPISNRPLFLEAGAYLVLVRDGSVFERSFPGVAYLQVAPWPSLNNAGDRIGLSEGGIEVEAVPYVSSWGTLGLSLERIDPSGPSWHGSNWTSSQASAGGSPGARNSVFASDGTPPTLIFADRIVQDTVLAHFDEAVRPLGAEAFLGVAAARTATWLDDRTVALVGISGDVVTVVGATDLTGNGSLTSSTGIARGPQAGEILVSERLAQPVANATDFVPDQPYFLELWNASPWALSLRGLRLELSDDERGPGLVWDLPFVPRSIQPGEVALITSSPDLLAKAFALPLDPWIVRAPAEILRANRVGLQTARADQIDVAGYSKHWLDPSRPSSGRSLVRIGSDGERAISWTSSVAGLATPGWYSPQSVLPSPKRGDIVISEVLFDARAGQTEFVEFLGLGQVDLNGCYLLVDRSPSPPDSVRIAYGPLLLAAGQRVVGVVPTSGVPLAELGAFARSGFPGAGSSSPWLPLKGASSFRDSGVMLELFTAQRELLDRVEIGPSFHHPGLASGDGISLVRRDPTGSSAEGTNWTSSIHPDGSSPGSGPALVPSTGSASVPQLRVIPRVFDPNTEHAAIHVHSELGYASQIQIFDRRGNRVRDLVTLLGPDATVYWDGRNSRGRLVAPGVYVVFADVGRGTTGKEVVVVARR